MEKKIFEELKEIKKYSIYQIQTLKEIVNELKGIRWCLENGKK